MSRGTIGPVDNTDIVNQIEEKIKNAGGVVISNDEPTNKNCMWVDGTGVMRYYDPSTETWKSPRSVFV